MFEIVGKTGTAVKIVLRQYVKVQMRILIITIRFVLLINARVLSKCTIDRDSRLEISSSNSCLTLQVDVDSSGVSIGGCSEITGSDRSNIKSAINRKYSISCC